MKISRIHRLLKLITLLQTGRPYQANDLAQELNVSRRTLFRDLNLIRAAGIPLHYDPNVQSHAIEKSFFLPPPNFTLQETLGLMMVLKKYVSRRHLLNFQDVASAMMKIESSLPREFQNYCGTALESIEFQHAPTTTPTHINGIFEQLWEAVHRRRAVDVNYGSLHDQKDICTRVYPYRLLFISRAWYLIAHSAMHNMPRTFKLDRIKTIRPTNERFEVDPNFNLQDYFGNAWSMIPGDRRYDVRIRFSPKVARNVEEVLWHPTQQVTHLPDGSIHYEVTVDGLGEIIWWILGYGQEAFVEEPPELQHLIREHIDALSATYVDLRDNTQP